MLVHDIAALPLYLLLESYDSHFNPVMPVLFENSLCGKRDGNEKTHAQL